MEESKTKVIIIISLAIIVILVVASIRMYLITNESKGITAMEGKETADRIAKEWNESAVLYYIMGIGEIYDNGRCEGWRYEYINQPEDVNDSVRNYVIIFENGTTQTVDKPSPMNVNTFSNWNIDCEHAVEIAKANGEIKQWLAKYGGTQIQSITLSADENNTGWGIVWSDTGFMDDPHSAGINIDAATGEVLYVEADN